MSKKYWLKFGSGDPRTNTGLFPTLVIFNTEGGTALSAPGITEAITGSGLYQFTYGPTISIAFLADGGAGLSSSDRFIAGVLDPIQAVDQRVGVTGDSFGSTAIDPSTVTGQLNRIQEFLEGDAIYTKATGEWSIYSRGSSQLLRVKSLTNTTAQSTKS